MSPFFDELGYSLVFTSPYTPILQPIELPWSLVKGYVARKFCLGRTVPLTREHILEGFYVKEATVHRTICKKHILKTLRHCDEFVDYDPELSGTIHHLQVKNAELSEEDLFVIETDPADIARLEGVSDVHFSDVNDYDSDSDDEFGGDELKDDN
jgi:hypothetical protein